MEKDLIDRYLTEEGKTTLRNRLNTLIKLFNDNDKWNTPLIMFGFKELLIEDREECFGRIKELSDLLNVQLKMEKIITDKIDYQITMCDVDDCEIKLEEIE